MEQIVSESDSNIYIR